jgi:predicted acyltransferase
MKNEQIKVVSRERLYSLDALRGFDMFWITGGGSLIAALAKYTGAGWLRTVANQMEHAAWVGFNFQDLIFPLFMFISGVTIPFAVISKLEKNVPKAELAKKAVKRGLTLVLLGFIYNGVLGDGFKNPRFASVLGLIGLAYLCASLIVIYSRSFKSWLIWLFGILVGYGVLQLLVPVPGVGAGVLTPEGSINTYIDQMFLPGHFFGDIYDPEGILCVVSAIGIILMGAVAGTVLRDKNRQDAEKLKMLLIIGTSSVILSLVLSTFYPIIKQCWTSTFNLAAGGISFVLLAVFYWIIDVRGWKKWSFFFRVIGMNSIFIYMLDEVANVGAITKAFWGWTVLLGDFGPLLMISGRIMMVWLLLYYMYKRDILLRV